MSRDDHLPRAAPGKCLDGALSGTMGAMVDDPIPLSEVGRVLVIKLRHHGDVLLTSPVFSTLHARLPQCEIDALVYGDTSAMLTLHPAISQVHGIDRNWKKLGPLRQAAAEWRLLSQLRARHYDLVIHLSEHRRGAWLTRLLRPRWAVAAKLAGKFWRGSFTHCYAQPGHARRHTVEKNLDALRRIGIYPQESEKRLTLVPGKPAEDRVAALLAAHDLGGNSFIHLHPASRWQFKCWPAAQTAALITALHEQGQAIVLTAAADAKEGALIAAIRDKTGAPVVDLCGQLSLKELAALTHRARLFIGVDSAPMHIAAAMGTPTVALFGPSGELEWGPWQVASRIITSDAHPCRPCGLDGCGGGKVSECLTTLPLAWVLAACNELLNIHAT